MKTQEILRQAVLFAIVLFRPDFTQAAPFKDAIKSLQPVVHGHGRMVDPFSSRWTAEQSRRLDEDLQDIGNKLAAIDEAVKNRRDSSSIEERDFHLNRNMHPQIDESQENLEQAADECIQEELKKHFKTSKHSNSALLSEEQVDVQDEWRKEFRKEINQCLQKAIQQPGTGRLGQQALPKQKEKQNKTVGGPKKNHHKLHIKWRVNPKEKQQDNKASTKSDCSLQEEWKLKHDKESEQCAEQLKEREKLYEEKQKECEDKKDCPLQEEWRKKCKQEDEKCSKEQQEKELLCNKQTSTSSDNADCKHQEEEQKLGNKDSSTPSKEESKCSPDDIQCQLNEEREKLMCNADNDNCLKEQKERERLICEANQQADPDQEVNKEIQKQREKCEKEKCNCSQQQKEKDHACFCKQRKLEEELELQEMCDQKSSHVQRAPPMVPMSLVPMSSVGNPSLLSLQSNRRLQQGIRNDEQAAAAAWLDSLDEEFSQACNKNMMAEWNYNTNINEETGQKTVEAATDYAKFLKNAWQIINREFNTTSGRFPRWKEYKDTTLRRRIRKHLTSIGTAILPEEDMKKLATIQGSMETTYSTATICDSTGDKCGMHLDPELTEIMATSQDYDELVHVWKAWRDESGKKMRENYIEMFQYINKAAKMTGYKDASELWIAPYDTQTFKEDIAKLWEELTPWYKKLHAYMRRRLIDIYGESRISPTGPIPAHLLGNMWAQQWGNIASSTMPYPNASLPSITDALKEQKYDVQKMFKTSEAFFTSLGLEPMTEAFWQKSMFVKPKDREVVCHASAWDFCDGKDFRVKMCTEVNQENFVVVHHEMGHVQYFQQYKDQPSIFRDGSNPGFHEAVGDILALSVTTPKHLKAIGLLSKSHGKTSIESEINYLHMMALEKIAFIPFAFMIDKWRWDVFSGAIPTTEMNSHWWKLKESIQGVAAPVPRTEEDFDPGAKYHVAANVPYVRYFVSNVIQFQIYEALCKAAGQYDPNDSSKPLHQCDFYKNQDAGKLLKDVLMMGYSRPWQEAMKILTGRGTMSISSLKTYFKPLEDWLDCYLAKSGDCIGWGDDCQPGCEDTETSSCGSKRSAKKKPLPQKCKKFKIFN